MTYSRTAILAMLLGLIPMASSLRAQEGFGSFLKKATGKASETKEKKAEPKSTDQVAPVATLAKAVITKAAAKSFEEAKGQAIEEVSDGDPVFLCLELPEPVENYLARYTYADDMDRNKDKVLELAVGPAGKRKQTFQSGYFMPRPEDMKSKFLCINLAPGAVTRHWLGIWLKTVGKGREGVWKNEIRVTALGQTEATTTSEARLLAVVPLTANVPGGVSKYAAQADAYETRHEQGDASVNEAPTKGKLYDLAVRSKVLAEAKNQMPEKVEGFYFTDNEWGIRENELGRVDRNVTGGVVLFKREGKKMIRFVTITRWKFRNATDVRFGDESELSAEQYALAQSRAK